MYDWLDGGSGGGGGTAVAIAASAGEAMAAGALVYVSAWGTMKKADRTVLATRYVIGVTQQPAILGGHIDVQTEGVALVVMEAGLVLAPGDPIYLGTGGRATNVAPTLAGEALVEIGELLDGSMYAPGNLRASVIIEVEQPVVLS